MHSLSLSFALPLSFSLSPSTLGASKSRSYPSYTHAPLKRFYSAPPFPRNPPSLVSSSRDNARPYTTDCERGMSHPIRNFLLRFAPDHPRQLKSSTPSSRVHLDAPIGRCSRAKHFYLSALDPPRLPIRPVCPRGPLCVRERAMSDSLIVRYRRDYRPLLLPFSMRNLFFRGVTSKWTNPLCNQNEKQQSAQTVALIPGTHRKPIRGFLHDVI